MIFLIDMEISKIHSYIITLPNIYWYHIHRVFSYSCYSHPIPRHLEVGPLGLHPFRNRGTGRGTGTRCWGDPQGQPGGFKIFTWRGVPSSLKYTKLTCAPVPQFGIAKLLLNIWSYCICIIVPSYYILLHVHCSCSFNMFQWDIVLTYFNQLKTSGA